MYLSFGKRISAELSFVLSQFTRVTDRQTERRTDRHLCRGKDRPACMQRGKNVAIANALQLEAAAARRRAVPIRFNFVARVKFELAQSIR